MVGLVALPLAKDGGQLGRRQTAFHWNGERMWLDLRQKPTRMGILFGSVIAGGRAAG